MKPAKLARSVFWKRAVIYVLAAVLFAVFLVLAHVASAVEFGYLATLEDGEELAQNQGLELVLIIIAFLIVPVSVLAFAMNSFLAGSERKAIQKLGEYPTEQRMEMYRLFRRQYVWYLLGCLAVGGAAIAIPATFHVYLLAMLTSVMLLVVLIIVLMCAFLPAPSWQRNQKKREEDQKERKELIL